MFATELDTNNFNCQMYNTEVMLNFPSNKLLKRLILNAHFNEILQVQWVLPSTDTVTLLNTCI